MITLEDVQKRADGILAKNPDIPRCGFMGCENAIDHTEGLGWDSSCPYHRLLFDHFLYDVDPVAATSKKAIRRPAFSKWVEETGKEECDRIVLHMAQDNINWMC